MIIILIPIIYMFYFVKNINYTIFKNINYIDLMVLEKGYNYMKIVIKNNKKIKPNSFQNSQRDIKIGEGRGC